MDKSNVAASPPRTPFRFAWYATRGHRRWAVAAIIVVAVAQSGESLFAVLVKLFTDAAIGLADGSTADIHAAWLWAAALPVAFFVINLIWRISGICGMQWITQTRAAVHQHLFAHLTVHSNRYFADRFAGSLANKVTNAAWGTSNVLGTSLWELWPLVVSLVAHSAIAWWADWRLGAILAVWFTAFIAVNVYLVYRKKPLAYAVAEQSSVLKGKVVDAASNITAIHHGGHYDFERRFVSGYIDRERRADVRSWLFSEGILTFNGAMVAIFFAAMAFASLFLLLNGSITLGSVVMIVTIVVNIQHTLLFIGFELTDFMDHYGKISEGLSDLLVPHEITDAPDARPFAVRDGRIMFDGIRFAYGDNPVFQGFDLTIPGGQRVGLVGRSGAGKTTLIALLLRQYDVQNGAIRIDGRDVRSMTLESLRRSVAVVPQDVTLFHRSIRDNIGYGNLDATDREIEDAARKAQAHTFIETLPKGYATLVGERGVKLSTGQRQRIAIARAFLKDAPILILDEATSALDSESEAAVQRALANLVEGRTVIAVAHRLSTLRAMDRILVLQDGSIPEDGSHEELRERGGLYASLWEHQVKGFIGEG